MFLRRLKWFVIIILLVLCTGVFIVIFNQLKLSSGYKKTLLVELPTGWLIEDGKEVYILEDHTPASGWMELDGKTYFFNEDGTYVKGKNEIDGKTCYFDEEGNLMSGWAEYENTRLYLGKDGSPDPGWLEYKGERYYIKENGEPSVGLTKMGDTYYLFDNEGALRDENYLMERVNSISSEYGPDSDISPDTLNKIGSFDLTGPQSGRLNKIIEDTSRNGAYNISFVLMDLNSGNGISYNVDKEYYSASCIKAPYITSLIVGRPEVLDYMSNTLKIIIVESDNEKYSNLRQSHGRNEFITWCKECGVNTDVCIYNYPRITAEELAKFWVHAYFYYNTDETGALIGTWLENPNASAIHSVLGPDSPHGSKIIKTQSKAGWICEDGYRSTTDAGIIYPKNSSPYLISICTDIPSDMASLEPLAEYLGELAESQ
ncbi:MAG: hypothetical protein J5517_02545 [Eubacterium sp.]|nr:hypothetical protein [Eubacterium sp.]